MATPKEQHDARPNARNIGRLHVRALPADATPPGGIRALTMHDLASVTAPATAPTASPPDERRLAPAEHP